MQLYQLLKHRNTLLLNAQDRQVNGFVIDASTEEVMPYVNIAIVGSTYGTVSNQNGEFTIKLEIANENDSIAFHYIGYETFYSVISALTDGVIIKMKKEQVNIKEITILANPVTVEELINNALYRRGTNYPDIFQKMEVFKRRNNATYIKHFDLSLIDSDIQNIDTSFIKTLVDSIPHYSRSYQDNLYTLFSAPQGTQEETAKIQAIKRVFLEEDDGGELGQIENILMNTINKQQGDKTFWKLKTGIFSIKVNDSHPDDLSDTSKISKEIMDSLSLTNPRGLYKLTNNEFENWSWDFIQKPERYKYEIEGIVPIADEFAYAISFRGRIRGDYQGMIYISDDTYAILRIEYSIKNRRKESGFKLLGVSYREVDDSGLLIYSKDEHGYFLKYSMNSNASAYAVKRNFSMLKKEKRPIIRKKLNEVELSANFNGSDDSVQETLVVYREKIDRNTFSGIKDKSVKPEHITSYSDTIWQGYSIIEPTKQMKEYRAKIK